MDKLAAISTATASEEILRDMSKPFVDYPPILTSRPIKKAENPPRVP